MTFRTTAVQFLCEMYLATGEKRYLNGARKLMPALEALHWHQPSYRMTQTELVQGRLGTLLCTVRNVCR